MIAGLQEGLWPNTVPRGGVLATQHLVDVIDGVADPMAGVMSTRAPLLAEERRLLVAALGRARSHVVVTAVDGDEGDESALPSPFCDELAALTTERPRGYRRRIPFTRRGCWRPPPLVGRLRAVVCAPAEAVDEASRACAATQLARLAAAGVPGAEPGAVVRHHDAVHRRAAVVGGGSRRDAVAVDAADADRLPAAVAAGTPRRRRRTRRAVGARFTGPRAGGRPGQGRGPDDRRARTALGGAAFRLAVVLRQRAGAPPRDAARHSRSGARRRDTEFTEVGAEVDVDGVVEPADGPRPGVRVRGRVDRLERDAEGRLVVVDVKTGKTPVSKDDAQRHAQLATYQLAIAEGLLPQGDQAGGARLVYLGKIGSTGACERDQDPMTPRGAKSSASRCGKPRPPRRARSSWRASTTGARTARCGRSVRRRRRSVVDRDRSLRPGRTGRRARHLPPTDEQAAVIAAPPGPLVVIAGAGAGKTETMAARVVWLVANGYAHPGRCSG